MEISMQINSKFAKSLSFLKTPNPKQTHLGFRQISCEASKVATPMQENKTNNLYKILSLQSENVDFHDIKKAYRTMALQYHPDVCASRDTSTKEESTRRFLELRKAYEILSDPVSRKRYDYELGLGDSFKFGPAGGFYVDHRSCASKEVWENQLVGLKRRSSERMRRNKNVQV